MGVTCESDAVGEIGRKVASLGESTRDDSGARCSKNKVEKPKRELVCRHAKMDEVFRANKPIAISVGQCPTYYPVCDGAYNCNKKR